MNLDDAKRGRNKEDKNLAFQATEAVPTSSNGYDYIQSECANTLKKKKLLCVTWNDDDSSSGFDSKKDHQNFIAFTANVKDDFKKELDTGCDEDFLKTYKDMLGK
ncbi:hypothetical protein Gorai_008073 [Gossypium raimondii]|uniref:Uncharacterized protein n=1 Tax=Gossypium raimondii TaxID=29730 RepID=A0A7J8Q9N3_GOSRA|nr:hypothetical protein [Gossypium raimondii]